MTHQPSVDLLPTQAASNRSALASIQLPEFSIKYFNSLEEHAVPLTEHDLAALAHSALAIDIYSWLAQRLHRVPASRSAFIQWPALKLQFGPDFTRMIDFKRKFHAALKQVHCRYKAAKFEIDACGMRLFNSPPPVAKRLISLSAPLKSDT